MNGQAAAPAVTGDSVTGDSVTGDYGVLEPANVYLDDLDAMGMLHNSRYAVLVERAWVSFWLRQDDFDFLAGSVPVGDGFNAVKALAVIYELPVSAPGEIAVQLWIERLGRSSMTHGFRICSADGARTYAHGSRTLVRLDPRTLRPAEWSARAVTLAQQLLRRDE